MTKRATFETFNKFGRWWWRILNPQMQPIAVSTFGYASERGAERSAGRALKLIRSAPPVAANFEDSCIDAGQELPR